MTTGPPGSSARYCLRSAPVGSMAMEFLLLDGRVSEVGVAWVLDLEIAEDLFMQDQGSLLLHELGAEPDVIGLGLVVRAVGPCGGHLVTRRGELGAAGRRTAGADREVCRTGVGNG